MSRTDIIKELVDRTGMDVQQVTDFCDTLVDIITDSLLENKKVSWKGFLSAEVIERGQRKGKCLATGEATTFPPVKTIRCRISKNIKDLVNER